MSLPVPAGLVHEAFIKLAGKLWVNSAQLLAVAAITMRGILVDHARKRSAAKRGGERNGLSLKSDRFNPAHFSVDVPAIFKAINSLKIQNGRRAQIVELRFFGGMPIRQVAEVLGVSESTVEAEWRFARAWLSAKLSDAT